MHINPSLFSSNATKTLTFVIPASIVFLLPMFITGNLIADNTNFANSTYMSGASAMYACNDSDNGVFSGSASWANASSFKLTKVTVNKKTVSVWKLSTSLIYKDACVGFQVREPYCTPQGRVAYAYINCPTGCVAGACKQVSGPPCIDSDALLPNNLSIKGNVSGGLICYPASLGCRPSTRAYFDSCSGDSVSELYCAPGGRVESMQLSCPSGQSCEDGACVANRKFIRLMINETYNSTTGNTSFELISAEPVYDYYGFPSSKAETYYPEEGYPFIIQTYDSANNIVSRYQTQSSRFILFDDFGNAANPGGMMELNYSTIEATIPYKFSEWWVAINNTLENTLTYLDVQPGRLSVERDCRLSNETVNWQSGEKCCSGKMLNPREGAWVCG